MNPADMPLPPSRPSSPPLVSLSVLRSKEQFARQMFMKDNISNYLYDETGKVDLPANEDGSLVLDPASKRKLMDAIVERRELDEYLQWIESALEDTKQGPGTHAVERLRTFKESVVKDRAEAGEKCDKIVNEERLKRGLIDFDTHVDWYNKKVIDDVGRICGSGGERKFYCAVLWVHSISADPGQGVGRNPSTCVTAGRFL